METVTQPNPDAPSKHGQGLRALVLTRRDELEEELRQIQKGGPGNSADVEAALSALVALLTGNLDQIPPVVAQEMMQWIETSQYLGAKPRRAPDGGDSFEAH